jgi:DNA-binding transcriptional LysR family regulator
MLRHPTGYRLSEFGEALLPAAEAVESTVTALERTIIAYRSDLAGTIRLTVPEPIVSRLAASPLFDIFHQRYPALRFEFVMSDRYLDLAKGQADVALRSASLTTKPWSAARSPTPFGPSIAAGPMSRTTGRRNASRVSAVTRSSASMACWQIIGRQSG